MKTLQEIYKEAKLKTCNGYKGYYGANAMSMYVYDRHGINAK